MTPPHTSLPSRAQLHCDTAVHGDTHTVRRALWAVHIWRGTSAIILWSVPGGQDWRARTPALWAAVSGRSWVAAAPGAQPGLELTSV